MNRINTVKLHRLILSLKKEEKRFFKLFTKKQNQKEDIFYLKIFDYLDKLEVVDRDKFKSKFKDVKGLSGLQTYLYKLILKSLRNQPAYNNVDVVLREGLADLDIFYKKELLTDAQEKLQELLEIAKLHDRIFFLPMLYEWWFILENSHFHYQQVEAPLLEQNIEKYANSIENLKQYHLYRTELGHSLMLLKENKEGMSKDMTRIAESLPAYTASSTKYSLSVRVQQLQLKRILATLLVDAKTAYFYADELSSLLKKQVPEIFEVYEGFYYRALMSQITYAPTIESLSSIIEEIEIAMLEKKKHFDHHVPMNLFINKIDIYLLTSAFDDFKTYVEANQHNVDFLTNSAPQSLRDFWYNKWMLYHYATKQYTEALTIFDDFLMGKEVNMMLKKPSLYLKMVIYYEEEEYILLASVLKNMTRLLRKNNALLDPEKQLITLITKLIKLPKSEHKGVFLESRKCMVDYLGTIEESKKDFLTYFNYIGWIDSQISGAPFENLYFRHTGVIDLE
jgi:hypothetical protein